MRALALVGLALIGLAACAPPAPLRQPGNVLDARYRLARLRPARTAATAVYRATANLGTRCHMWPSDSVAFDLRAARCGAVWAMALGVARLLLEETGDPRFGGVPVRDDGRLRWMDLPTGCLP